MLVTQRGFESTLRRIRDGGELVVDTETTGLDVYGDDSRDVMCGTAIKIVGGKPFYFPFRHHKGKNLPHDLLRPVMDAIEHAPATYMFNSPFDLNVLWKDGLAHDIMAPRDVMVAAHLVNENLGRGNYGLKKLAVRCLGEGADMADKLLESILLNKLLTKGDIWRLTPKEVAPYACADTALTEDLWDFLIPHLDKQGLDDVWSGVSDYSLVMAHIMRRGLPINLEVIGRAMTEAHRRIHDCAMQVFKNEGRMIAINSPTEAAKWLGVESTSEKSLERIVGRDDWRVSVILAYRKAQRAIGSYYKPLLWHTREHIQGHGRYHADLSLIGTITGRPAFWGGKGKMNVLALPRDTTSYRVKHAIEAPEGFVIVQVDYKAAEMRLASHYGREKRMTALFQKGLNPHQVVSSDLKIPYDKAKRIDFSVIYGIGPDSLAAELDVPVLVAAQWLGAFHRRYPGFSDLYRKAQRQARRDRYIRMWTGRRRHYHGEDADFHKASDHLVQGGVGELLRVKQTLLHHRYREVQQILQCYDSAVMLVPENRVLSLIPEIRDTMTERDQFTVPMEVDVGVGPNMAELKEV